MSGRELAGFFDLVERVGCVRLPASTLADSVSVAALAALRAEHLLEDAGAAEALPCPHRAGCAREVRDTWEEGPRVRDARKRYLTACGQTPPECEGTWLSDDDVRTMVIRLAQLVRLTTQRFGVQRLAGELPHTWGAPTEPRAIGTQERARARGQTVGKDATRDVFLSLRPNAEMTASWLSMRERAGRAAVVLVPTMRRIASELAAEHGPMDKVEIVALEDALAVHGGAILVSPHGAVLRGVTAENASNDVGSSAPRKPKKPRRRQRKTRAD